MIISPGDNKWENLIKYEKKNEWMNKKKTKKNKKTLLYDNH